MKKRRVYVPCYVKAIVMLAVGFGFTLEESKLYARALREKLRNRKK